MRAVAKWMIWWLVSVVGAAAGVLLGYVTAVIVYPLFSFVSFFLILFLGPASIFAGMGLAGVAGGAVAGTVIGFIQGQFLDGEPQYIDRWVKLGRLGWAVVGILTVAVVVPVKRGDLSQLVWLIALGALTAGVAQWIGLWNHLPQAGWRALTGTLGTLIGGLAGIALLGAVSGRGATEPFQSAITFREFVSEAGATGLTNLNGKLVFFVTAEDAYRNTWWELWTSDGTPGGTLPVQRAYTGGDDPRITRQAQFNDMLFFSANCVLDIAYARSWKNQGGQWRTDGTTAGTILLDSYFPDLTALGRDRYFRIASEGSPCTPYRVTANDASPNVVRQLTGRCEGELAASESTLFFLTREEEAEPPLCTLWRCDGTADGTLALRPFEQDLRHDCPSDLLAVNGQLFMIAPTAAERELWISDGTQAGTHPVKKLDGVTEPLSYSPPIQAGGVYFVVVADKIETCALWRSDGSAEGTFRLKPLCSLKLTHLDKTLIFVERRDQGGWDLWRSDGTVEGTAVVSGFFSASRDLAPKLSLVLSWPYFNLVLWNVHRPRHAHALHGGVNLRTAGWAKLGATPAHSDGRPRGRGVQRAPVAPDRRAGQIRGTHRFLQPVPARHTGQYDWLDDRRVSRRPRHTE